MGRKFIYYIPPTAFIAGQGHKVSIVYENESGHYPTGGDGRDKMTPWYWGNPNDEATSFTEAEATAKMANARLGLDEKEVMDILTSSMAAKK